MAHTVSAHTNTAADALRDALGKAERQVVNINAENVETFLVTLDWIEAQFERMAHDAIDLRPEEARWESLLRRISSKPNAVALAAARAGGYAKLRAAHPPAESFWWHLDAEVNRRRRDTLLRLVVTLAAIVVFVGGGLWLVNRFFPPDPDAVFLLNAQSDIDDAVLEQDFETALTIATTARAQLPDAVELAVWEAVLTERVGDPALAAARLDAAQTLLPDRAEEFWVLVGNTRFQVADLEGAEAASDLALAANPESAQAHFLMANIAEVRGDRAAAIELFDRTFLLAEDENPQLAVIAKVRLGQLLQSPGNFAPAASSETVTPEPSPVP